MTGPRILRPDLIEPCPTCGAEHDGPCPFEPGDTCPECGEQECVCDFDPDFVPENEDEEWF